MKKKNREMILFSSHSERKKMEKEREEIRGLQGHEKEKDLASSFDETRSKTMRFYFWQTLNVFVQMGGEGGC